MTWRDDLRRVTMPDGRELIGASFRGVPFFVDSSERGGGRRIVVHEFPYSDDPYVEDLGRRARTYRIEGYVLGDDYLAERDTLLNTLEDTANAGVGTLVHPYYGTLVVICTTYSVSERKSDGGLATFSIEFAEAPAQKPVPIDDANAADQVSDSADAANDATDAEFAEQYSSSVPTFALASAETAILNATSALKNELAPVVSATQEAAQLTGQLALITAEASSLVTTPAVILGKFHDALSSLVTTVQTAPGDVMNALLNAYGADLGPIVVAITATRVTELANQTALTSALRRVFAIEAARIAPLVPYTTTDDATAARDQIVAILDEQAALAGDTAYAAIVDLRAQVAQAVPGSNTFASIVTVTRRVPIPSLLLAYQLYGSVDNELDIVARNDIRHPGFVVGDLKVLTGG